MIFEFGRVTEMFTDNVIRGIASFDALATG